MSGTAEPDLTGLSFAGRLNAVRKAKGKGWDLYTAVVMARIAFRGIFTFSRETLRRFERGDDPEEKLLGSGRNPLFLIGLAEAYQVSASTLSPDVAARLQEALVIAGGHFDRWDPGWRENAAARLAKMTGEMSGEMSGRDQGQDLGQDLNQPPD